MMKQKHLIIGGIVIAAVIALYFLYKSMMTGKDGCLKVSSSATPWQSDMSSISWGEYDQAKIQYLGVERNTLESEYVDGWFKAADLQPHAKYVRKYSTQIKAWLASGRAGKHWLVEKGEIRCSN